MGFSQVHRVHSRLTTGLGGLKPIWILVPSSLGRYTEGTGFRAVTGSLLSDGVSDVGGL